MHILNKLRLIIILTVAFLSFSSNAKQLASIHSLLKSADISSIKLNPQGNYAVSYGYPKGLFTVKVYALAGEEYREVDVYKAKEGSREYLTSVGWIDANSIYFTTNNTINQRKSWLVDITIDDFNDIKTKRHSVFAKGQVIDYLPEIDDTVWFAARRGKYNRKLKIYKAKTSALIKNNFKQEEFFSHKLEKAYAYYTDHQQNIRFAESFDNENSEKTLWYLSDSNRWKSYFVYDSYEQYFRPIGFLPNGKLAVISNVESDLKSLFEFDVKTKSFGKLLYQHEKYDLSSVKYDKETMVIESVSYLENGEYKIHYLAKVEQQINKAIASAFKGKQYALTSYNSNKDKAILFVFDSDAPGQYYVFDKQNKKAMLLADKYDYADTITFQKTQSLTITSPKGHEVEAYITKPSSSLDNKLLLVMPHGGPIGIRNSRYFSQPVQYLVNRGYSVLQVNFRGSEGYGKAFQDSGRGQFGRVIEEDISLAVDHVLGQTTFDHVCAMGASYGGYSSVMLAAKSPQLYDCIIARFGVYDLPLIYNDRNSKREDWLLKIWEKVVGKNDGTLEAVSPVYFAEKIKAPILITAGVLDTRASFEHSNRLKIVLASENADMEHIYYPHSAHGHHNLERAKHELAYIDDFIKRKISLPIKTNNSKAIKKAELRLIARGFERHNIAGKQKARARSYRKRAKALN